MYNRNTSMREVIGVFDVKELACYIKKQYFDFASEEISPIKLQKSLYFLFAYWGGFVQKGINNPDFSEEKFSENDRYLYNARIEAWIYGPVIPDVYRDINLDSHCNDNLFDTRDDIKKYVDDFLRDTFEVSDFKLVESAHNDEAWKSKFSLSNEFHNREIDKEELINEYALK